MFSVTVFPTPLHLWCWRLEINIKDNRYRIIYRTIDIASVISPNDHFNNDCVNFNGVEQNVIESYNEKMEGLLKIGFFGKKKEMILNQKLKHI